MEAGSGSGIVEVGSLKNDKEKRQYHGMRYWRSEMK